MKKPLFIFALAMLWVSCSTTQPLTKSEAYKGIYDEKPLSVLLMPPINRSTAVDAKEYFHSTLNIPIAEAGYYVIPTFLSMEMLKRESAYDAELFIDAPLQKFGEIFGADVALFTIIHKWDKTYGMVYVDVEYIIKSTKTNEVLFTRRGDISYNTTIQLQSSGGTYGALIAAVGSIAATAAATATTKYVDVARIANIYTFNDIPSGIYYTPLNPAEPNEIAGFKEFKVKLNARYAEPYK